MIQETNSIIKYDGKQITMFSDDRNDYVNLTDMIKAYESKKSVATWLKSKQTIEFLGVWEKRYNPKFKVLGFEYFLKEVKLKNFSISIQNWVEKTDAIGLFSRLGSFGGTYAHKDIALKFAGWLSPEFELFLMEEIQRLKKIEEQKNSFELLDHKQILALVQLKEVFKYVIHQEAAEAAHKEVYAANSNGKNPFAEFNNWRNKMLDINPSDIDDRIMQYCIDNHIALTKSMLKKPKREKILILDSYQAVRNAVWDFLQMQGEANALNLANLVEKMVRIEKGIILRTNETNLLDTKQDLGNFTDFKKLLEEMPQIKTARQLLEVKKEQQKQLGNLSNFNKALKKGLDHNPNDNNQHKLL